MTIVQFLLFILSIFEGCFAFNAGPGGGYVPDGLMVSSAFMNSGPVGTAQSHSSAASYSPHSVAPYSSHFMSYRQPAAFDYWSSYMGGSNIGRSYMSPAQLYTATMLAREFMVPQDWNYGSNYGPSYGANYGANYGLSNMNPSMFMPYMSQVYNSYTAGPSSFSMYPIMGQPHYGMSQQQQYYPAGNNWNTPPNWNYNSVGLGPQQSLGPSWNTQPNWNTQSLPTQAAYSPPPPPVTPPLSSSQFMPSHGYSPVSARQNTLPPSLMQPTPPQMPPHNSWNGLPSLPTTPPSPPSPAMQSGYSPPKIEIGQKLSNTVYANLGDSLRYDLSSVSNHEPFGGQGSAKSNYFPSSPSSSPQVSALNRPLLGSTGGTGVGNQFKLDSASQQAALLSDPAFYNRMAQIMPFLNGRLAEELSQMDANGNNGNKQQSKSYSSSNSFNHGSEKSSEQKAFSNHTKDEYGFFKRLDSHRRISTTTTTTTSTTASPPIIVQRFI